MIKTSIIVPVYNTEKYLRDCFESIYRQTQKEIEVIAVDDGSTDNSLRVLAEIQAEHPDLIICSQENRKQGAARNKGMELATGEFIYFMDSDDCIMDTAMDTCYLYAKENQLDMVMFDAEIFGDIECEKENYDRTEKIEMQYSVLSGEMFAEQYWRTAFYPSPCLLYTSARFLRDHDLKFLPGIYYEDNEFYCKSLPLAQRVMYIPQVLFRRRYRQASTMTSVFDTFHARDFLSMIQAVNRLQYSGKMKPVMYEMQLRFLRGLYERSAQGNLLSDIQFARELYETAVHICGGTVEKADSYYGIEILYDISKAAPVEAVPCELKKKIENRRRKIIQNLFAGIPLLSESQYVGIYGTGKNTERFLDEYQNSVGQIRAKVIPIESNVAAGRKKYRGWNVYCVDDIGQMPLACIVVASSKYEKEICQILQHKYDDRFRVVRLSADLHF